MQLVSKGSSHCKRMRVRQSGARPYFGQRVLLMRLAEGVRGAACLRNEAKASCGVAVATSDNEHVHVALQQSKSMNLKTGRPHYGRFAAERRLQRQGCDTACGIRTSRMCRNEHEPNVTAGSCEASLFWSTKDRKASAMFLLRSRASG